MDDLLPYHVTATDPEDFVIGALVWATNEAEAASLGRTVLLPDADSDAEITVDREPLVDGFGPPPSPVVESRDRWLRAYGFSAEDDDICDACGLASMDGAFPVCPDCECCEECGHQECPRVLLLGEARAKAFGPVRGRLIYLASEVDHHDPLHEARFALLSKLLVHMGGMPVLAAPSAPRKPWQITASLMPARAIHRSGGGVLGLELDTGKLSVSAALSLSSASSVGTARPRGPLREADGVAQVQWASLTPAFVAAGMEAEWKALEEASPASTSDASLQARADVLRLQARVVACAVRLHRGARFREEPGEWIVDGANFKALDLAVDRLHFAEVDEAATRAGCTREEMLRRFPPGSFTHPSLQDSSTSADDDACRMRWDAILQRMRARAAAWRERQRPRLLTAGPPPELRANRLIGTTAPKPLRPLVPLEIGTPVPQEEPVADVRPCLQVERDGLGEPAVCTLISGHASAQQDGESGHAWSLLSPTDDA